MHLSEIICHLEDLAPPSLQESYDNAGLLTGNQSWTCTGILCSLDVTEAIIGEAIAAGCNLVVAHHPLLFSGLKRINGYTPIERAVIKAIKHDIALYAIHTNLDNVLEGVNGRMADRLGIAGRQVLEPKASTLQKLYTYVPFDHLEGVRNALFAAGGGQIGQYSECSFSIEGSGTFKAGKGASPYIGAIGERHTEKEAKLEVIFPEYLQKQMVAALKKAHPYEEVAYEVLRLENTHPGIGSGLYGNLPAPMEENDFLDFVKKQFHTAVIRHTGLRNRKVQKVAVCGGAGSFLVNRARSIGADVYISADFKYHEFFEGDEKMMVCDIGHFESEQFTMDLLVEFLRGNFLTFAVLKSGLTTNPVHYYF